MRKEVTFVYKQMLYFHIFVSILANPSWNSAKMEMILKVLAGDA
jgi:hypothetical protein